MDIITIALIGISVVGVVIGGVTGSFFQRVKAMRFKTLANAHEKELEAREQELSELRAKLAEEAEEKAQKAEALAALNATMVAEQKASQQTIDTLGKMREDMQAKFKELASSALETQGAAFSKANIEKLDASLKPLRDEFKNLNANALRDNASLKTTIEALSARSVKLSEQTEALTRALKSDKQRQGAWGEMVLETILESSGLRKGYEYEFQAHRTSDEGRNLRPDVVVRLPEDKTLVIDSKVSLVDYVQAVNDDEDDAARAIARKNHAKALKAHVNDLSARGYDRAEEKSVDYVIMFLPIEGMLFEALATDKELSEYALGKNVMIATPTTLMMALKTVAHVWAAERRNQNAEAIARRAGLLYDKIVGFVENMNNVGKSLAKAQDAHQSALNQLSQGRGNMLSQTEELKRLGAKTNKSLARDFSEDTDDAGDKRVEVETDAAKMVLNVRDE